MRTNKFILKTIDESITECFQLLRMGYTFGSSELLSEQRVAVTYLIELKEQLGLITKSRMRWEKDVFEKKCNTLKYLILDSDI